MKYLLSLLILSISLSSFAQIDTTKIYSCKQFKKGFYKSYNQFITNSPSITYDFIVTPLSENQNDTLDTRVDFTLIDSTTKHTGRVWGFCDGTNVYVKYNKASGLQIADNSFLKLHVGRYPFFSFKDRSSSPVILLPGFGLAGAVVGAASIGNAIAAASKPYSSKDYSLCIITSNGKLVKRPQVADVKALLANHPELLESFEKEYNNPSVVNYNSDDLDSEIYNLLKEYLFKLNEGYKKFIFH